MLSLSYVLIIFNNIQVLNYFTTTLRTTVAIVNVSLVFWLIVCVGISFLNLSLYAGYSEMYNSYFKIFGGTFSGEEATDGVKGQLDDDFEVTKSTD
jgi:hypothetical protein